MKNFLLLILFLPSLFAVDVVFSGSTDVDLQTAVTALNCGDRLLIPQSTTLTITNATEGIVVSGSSCVGNSLTITIHR